jgi:hypothetical protein
VSAGCIKKKADRMAIVKRTVECLEKALKIMKKHPDPDKAPREIEEAYGFILRCIGPEYPDGPIHKPNGTLDYSALMHEGDEEPPEHWKVGLSWLTEHYFS